MCGMFILEQFSCNRKKVCGHFFIIYGNVKTYFKKIYKEKKKEKERIKVDGGEERYHRRRI